MNKEFEIVIHTEFGGFTLSNLIVERLRAANCPWIDKMNQYGDRWYSENQDSIEFRCDPFLISAVKEVTLEYDAKSKGLDYSVSRDLRKKMLAGLKVQEGNFSIEIQDYDGKESVTVNGGCW